MKRYTEDELKEVLRLHELWRQEKYGGVRVNLVGANLRGVNLRNANLRGVNLRGVNLRNANLWRANLVGANLRGVKGVSTFQYNKHLAVAYLSNSRIKIGCEDMSTEEWCSAYEEIGQREGYTQEEITAYGMFVNLVRKLHEKTTKEKECEIYVFPV